MIARAQLRFVRGSARKMRQVIDLIRKRDVQSASIILSALNKRPAVVINKLLRSAVANAGSKGVPEQDLYISRIFADEAVRWKRYQAAAFGRATVILKRTSHVTIELDVKPTVLAKKAKQQKAAPKKRGIRRKRGTKS